MLCLLNTAFPLIFLQAAPCQLLILLLMLIFTSLTSPHVDNCNVLSEVQMWDNCYLLIFYNEGLDQMMYHDYAHAMFMPFASYVNVFLILSQIYPFNLNNMYIFLYTVLLPL